MTESDDDEENPGAPNTQKDDEIAALEKQVEESISETEELRKKADSAEHKYFHMKRSGDLAKNKITTATECLDMFLRENLKKPNFKDFDPTFHFLVTQYSTLLYSPDFYTVDIDKKEVTLSEELFANLTIPDPKEKERLSLFKKELVDKLVMDLSVRQDRRNSVGGTARPRLLSNPTKRGNPDDMNNGKSKLTRPSHVSRLPSQSS